MRVCWLVIPAQRKNPRTLLAGKNRSRVTNVCNEAHLIDNDGNNGTWTTAVHDLLSLSVSLERIFVCPFGLCLLKAEQNRFFWVTGKAWLVDNKMVQAVAQEISTRTSAMAVKDAKERTPWPDSAFFVLWFHDVKDNWYTVFIISAHQTLVGVRSICSDYSVAFNRCLRRLVWDVFRKNDFARRLQRLVCVLRKWTTRFFIATASATVIICSFVFLDSRGCAQMTTWWWQTQVTVLPLSLIFSRKRTLLMDVTCGITLYTFQIEVAHLWLMVSYIGLICVIVRFDVCLADAVSHRSRRQT